MEFHIELDATLPDVAVVDAAVREADPAALVDVDGLTLRVATSLVASDLRSVLAAAGNPIESGRLTQLPSICCGGCSG